MNNKRSALHDDELGLEHLTKMANGYQYIRQQRDDLSAKVTQIKRQNVWLRILLLLAVAAILVAVWL